jgi:hypothetical protein
MAAMTRTVESVVFTRAGSRRRTAWENLDVSYMGPSEDKCHAPVRYIIKLIMGVVASTRASVPGRTSAEM